MPKKTSEELLEELQERIAEEGKEDVWDIFAGAWGEKDAKAILDHCEKTDKGGLGAGILFLLYEGLRSKRLTLTASVIVPEDAPDEVKKYFVEMAKRDKWKRDSDGVDDTIIYFNIPVEPWENSENTAMFNIGPLGVNMTWNRKPKKK